MKRITTVLSIILLLALLLSSCNMDSNTGLFQEAGQSEKKVNYTIYSVLAEISEKEYLVSSTDGVFVFNVDANNENAEKYLRGKDATQVLFAKDSTSWEFVYYNTDNNTFYQVTSKNTTPVEYTNIDSKKYKFSSSYTDLKNKEYALVFKDSENNNYVYYGAYPTTVFEPTKTEFEDVSYAGNGYFIGTKEKVRYIFKKGETTSKQVNNNTVSVISDNCYILKDGKIMINDENKNTSSDSITVGSSSNVVSYTEGGKTYIILPSTNNVFIYDGGTNLEIKDCAGLKNIEVKAILGFKNDCLNVITATSAAKSLNLKDGLISDWV